MIGIGRLSRQLGAGQWSSSPFVQSLVGVLLVCAVAVVTLTPVLVIVVGSFDVDQTGNPATFSLDAWRELQQSPRTHNAIVNSFLLALRAPISAVVAFFLAWLLIRTRLPGRGLVEFALWLAFFLPALPVTLGWILTLDPNYGLLNQALRQLPFVTGPVFNVYSIPGILWVHVTASTIPVIIILLGPAVRQLDASLEETGRVCGSGPLQVFRRITLPILAPAVVTAALASFIRSLEAFEVEQLLGRPAGIYVYSTRIYDLVSWEPPLVADAMALSTLVLGLLLLIALVYQRWTEGRHFATLTGRGVSFRPLDTGRWGYAVAALFFTYIAIAVLLPTVMLLLGSFMTLFGFFSLASPFTTRHWQEVLKDSIFLLSLRNSLVIGLATATVGTLGYALLAYVLMRTRLVGRRVVDLLVWLPWAVPGILLGIGLLWLILSSPLLAWLYGNLLALILVLIVKELPIGTHMMKTSVGQIAVELEQSSRVCGAGWLATFWRIVLPLARPMLVSIFVLVFVAALRDISTTVLLVTPSSRSLALLVLEYSSTASLESATVVGAIMTGMVTLVALLARKLGLQITQV